MIAEDQEDFQAAMSSTIIALVIWSSEVYGFYKHLIIFTWLHRDTSSLAG